MEHLDELISIKRDYLFKQQIEYSFIAGDTNFKTTVSKEEFLSNYKINKNCWTEFRDQDEFVLNKKKIYDFNEYMEVIPNFPPTFKYSIKICDFHESQKTPSWTD